MGVACGNMCSGSVKEQELDFAKSNENNVIIEKGRNPRNRDLEERFLEMLKEIEYPNTSVKVRFFNSHRNV